MPVMEGYDHDEYQVYIVLPGDADLGKIIDAGCKALGIPVDKTKEINLCHTIDPDCVGGVECRHRHCINPTHLEEVSKVENTRRRDVRHATF